LIILTHFFIRPFDIISEHAKITKYAEEGLRKKERDLVAGFSSLVGRSLRRTTFIVR